MTTAPPRGPHGLRPRLLLAFAFAAGGAALGALFLAGDADASILAVVAAVAALYGTGALLTPRPLPFLVLTSLPTAGALLAHLAPSLLSGLAGPPGFAAGAVSVVALALVLIFAAPATLAARARRAPSHDAFDRVVLSAATWLGLVAGVFAAGSAASTMKARWILDLGAGGLTWMVQALALAFGAALAMVVLARALSALRLLEPLAREEGTLTSIPRAEAATMAAGSTVLPWWVALPADGALVRRTPEGRSPFRTGEVSAVLAWLPLDLSAARRLLTRRACLAALVFLAEASGALALGREPWAHRAPLTHMVAVATGGHGCYNHACALRDDGHVLCWGTESSATREALFELCANRRIVSPRLVPGLDDATQLVSSWSRTCAVRRSGEVACWGDHEDEVPVAAAPDLPKARRISLSDRRGCVLTTSGEVACFTSVPGPWFEVAGVDAHEATDVVTSDVGGCVLRAGGAECWSQFEGDPSAPMTRWPCPQAAPCRAPETRLRYESRRVPPEAPESTCRIEKGTLRCWDAFGRRQPRSLDDVVQVSPGNTSCAVRTDGTVWCWGPSNRFGEIGDGTRRTRQEPTLVRE